MKRVGSAAASTVGSLCTAFRWCATAAKGTSAAFSAAAVRGGVELTQHAVVEGQVTDGGAAARTWWLAPGWLRENCTEVRHATGQSTVTLDQMSEEQGRVVDAAVVPAEEEGGGDVLRCTLTTAGEGAGLTCSDDDAIVTKVDVPLQRTLRRYGVSRLGVSEPVQALTSAEGLTKLQFGEVIEACKDPRQTNDVRKALFRALTADGITLIQGCPTDDPNALEQLARAVAPVSGMSKTLYGTDFHVNRDPSAPGPRNNIAYSGVFLDLHNDLVYHESMPGIQMLMARRFDDSVKGGESFFVDAMAAAEELRETRPDAFDTLTQIPRPFCKDDPARPVPACYYYGAPHIVTCKLTGHVSKVFWAPAFEAPFPVWFDEGAQRRYYDARRAFAAVLLKWRKERAVSLRMQPGDCWIWNQVRILHGRQAFVEEEPGSRSLHGCYCNIDDFASAARYALGDDLPLVPLANRSEL